MEEKHRPRENMEELVEEKGPERGRERLKKRYRTKKKGGKVRLASSETQSE